MGTRNRVLSFMSQFRESSNRDSQGPSPKAQSAARRDEATRQVSVQNDAAGAQPAPTSTAHPQLMDGNTEQPRQQRQRATSRPMSMVQTYQPPMMEVTDDTPPELQPIFTFLNSHANKLYQEGYFLKLDDQNTHGKPNTDRTWQECFAQLVGTVLSLWDAGDLDNAGQDGEVLPKFINLTDASIKMIESLPTRSDDEAPLQNILSISTAGKNRYLVHFNSHHSLTQWTAGIRLAMFEHATLQEAYTGALIAGKGKGLNNINMIMERSKAPTADWARVRFGAGTPWRRCWCVITPPDEKEVQKLQKQMNKKKSAYDRSRPPAMKGFIHFYDTKKTKKVRPIATINDAYSAFAIYPQAKSLIDQSTLVKVEGSITIHSNPPSTTEGFVFVMPEVHPAVTGFEMMLRWLFPVYDTFGLYGRPGRLVADVADTRSLMFAMPKHRRYGYLEILDVSSLILENGSNTWREMEWRKRMKELTGKRMTAIENGSLPNSRYNSRRSTRNSFGPSRSRIQFDDGASVRSSPSISYGHSHGEFGLPRTDSAPAASALFTPPKTQPLVHQRSVSETHGLDRYQNEPLSNYDGVYDDAPPPPPHAIGVASGREGSGLKYRSQMASTPERVSSEDEAARTSPIRELQELQATSTPEPVAPPPAFSHAPGALPISKPYHSPDLRRANSRMSNATLSQMAGAGRIPAGVAAAAAGYHPHEDGPRRSEDQSRFAVESGERGVRPNANNHEGLANKSGLNEGVIAPLDERFPPFDHSIPSRPSDFDSKNTYSQPPPPFAIESSQNVSYTSQPKPTQLREQQPRTYEPPQIHASTDSSRQTGHSSSQLSVDSSRGPRLPPLLQTRESINRKPLPIRKESFKNPTSAETASITSSLGHEFIDQAAFDMIGQDNRKPTLAPFSNIQRSNTGISSVYDDNDTASTDSPDYASPRRSIDTRKSVEKPRTGVMKTVGNTGLDDELYGSGAPTTPIHIDFGPTLNLTSDRSRSASPGPAQSYARAASPGPGMSVYPESPGKRLSAINMMAPQIAHNRTSSGDRRTLAWQPAMASTANNAAKRKSITAEQFVQQRAAVASTTPQYAHQRQSSGNNLRADTPTPPPARNRSSDRLALGGHSRHNSADLLQRPGSRGASAVLRPLSTGDMTTNLSAREQEQIARVTGQPLINMAQNNRHSASAGLVGAIEVRERERQQMKQGINSQAVQQQIAQRQQQQQQALYQQHADQIQGGYGMAQSPYSQAQYPQSQYGQYPQQYPVQAQHQQPFVSSAANVFAQGGGWSPATPSPAYTIQDQGRQSPSQYARQQYFPPQQQGRGNQGFFGHGH